MSAQIPPKLVYFRPDLPPLSEDSAGEFMVDAESPPVPNTSLGRDELWVHCYDDLMAAAAERIGQEVTRLNGSCAHVVDEHIEPKVSYERGEAWLAGTFTFVLYRHPAPTSANS
jgi:hypothetical protein